MQGVVAPAQVSRKNIPDAEDETGSRLVAAESNVTYRPVGLIVAKVLAALACVPSVATETRSVEGVQPDDAPAQVSRTKTSIAPLVSLSTRFIAEERNATYRPSALIEGEMLSPSAGLLFHPMEASVTEGTQPAGAPAHVSRTNIFFGLPETSVTPSLEASTTTV